MSNITETPEQSILFQLEGIATHKAIARARWARRKRNNQTRRDQITLGR